MAKGNLDDKIKQLQKLREEYEKLSKQKAPEFKTKGIDQVNDAIKHMTSLVEEAKDKIELLEDGFSGIHNSLISVVSEMKKTNFAASNTLKAFSGIEGIVKTLKYDQQGLEKLSRKQLDLQINKIDKLQKEIEINANQLAQQKLGTSLSNQNIELLIEEAALKHEISAQEEAMLRSAMSNFSVINDINKLINDRIQKEKQYEDALGITGAVGKSLKKTLESIGAGALGERLGIDEALKNAEESAKILVDAGNKVTIGDKLKIAGGFAKDLGKGLLKSLGPLTLITALIKSVIDAFKFLEESSGEVAKEFGISAHEGEQLVMASNQAAINSNDILVSTKDVVKAQMELNKIFGSSVQFSGEFAAEFASIQERTGLSADAMGFFAEQAMLTNTSIEDQLENVVGVTMELNAQHGVSISRKEIEEGMGKLTSAQLLTAKKNTKELVNQVFQAKMLGIELSAVEGIAQGLLDFESSIQAEMEAELLTGRQLNLETARQAALQGDLATVAEEVAKQMGSAEEFGKMNVIQQEALAKSIGMTRDGLADALLEQEKHEALREMGFKDMSDAQNQYNEALKNGTLTEEMSNKLKEKGLLEQLESATAQEKMAAMLEKIQSLFISIAEPLMAIISPIVDVLAPTLQMIMGFIQGISDMFGWVGEKINMILAPLGKAKVLIKGLAGIAVIFAAYKAYAAMAALGPLGVPLGIAAAAAATAAGFGAISKIKDGVIDPQGGVVVSGPKGSVQLDKEDSIIAGTDLGGKNKTKSEKQSQNIDLSPVVAELAAMKVLLTQLLTKKGDVYIDGAKAGYSMTLADSKMG